MSTSTSVQIEFDEIKGIIHIAYTEEYRISEKNELFVMFENLEHYLESLKMSKKIYLIIDISNLIIEPNLAPEYACRAERLTKKYFHKNGVAQYGYQITRIMLMRAYKEYLEKDPNIFRTKKDAYDYIESLIKPEEVEDYVEASTMFMSRTF